MTSRAQITRQAAADAVPAPTVERDYVLAHILASLASLGPETGLVFKGGTALRMCYLADFRYSADLDFSIAAGTTADAYQTIAAALAAAGGSIAGLKLTDDAPPRVAYTGPLGRERTLKLDFAEDELVLQVETCPLLPRWSDIPSGTSLPTYSLVEIAGEKIRCLLQRAQCRDLFDLWTLFNDGRAHPHDIAAIFRRKAEHRGMAPTALPERYPGRVETYRQRWQQELEPHIQGEVPPFDKVERAVSRSLRQAGLLGRE